MIVIIIVVVTVIVIIIVVIVIIAAEIVIVAFVGGLRSRPRTSPGERPAAARKPKLAFLHRSAALMPNLPTDIVDFGGFDLSIKLF